MKKYNIDTTEKIIPDCFLSLIESNLIAENNIEKTDDGFLYDCATSAIWAQENKLLLKVQIIDKYFGNALWEFSFKENSVSS